MFPSAVHRAAPACCPTMQTNFLISMYCFHCSRLRGVVASDAGSEVGVGDAGSSFHHRSSSRNFALSSSLVLVPPLLVSLPRLRIISGTGHAPTITSQRGKLLNLPASISLFPSFLPFGFLTRNILPPRIFRILCLPRGFHLLGRGIIEIRREYTPRRGSACLG